MTHGGAGSADLFINKTIILIAALVFLCMGPFLSGCKKNETQQTGESTVQSDEDAKQTKNSDETVSLPAVNPVKHIKRTETINGLKQEINILEIDLKSPVVEIKPVLSFDLIYGYELLSDMAAGKNAYAAINGGFFYDFGLPSGMVVIDGRLFSTSSGNYPVFMVEDGMAALKESESRITLEYVRENRVGNKGGSGEESDKCNEGEGAADDSRRMHSGSFRVDKFNSPAEGKEVAVYTPVYGSSSRAKIKNISATVEDGVVTKVAFYIGEVRIPKNGMVVSFFDTAKYAGIEAPLEAGDIVNIIHEPALSNGLNAYECGAWLVRDGQLVVPKKDPWVGVLTNRDPRTAVGIKEDGTVILLTVDGRQPDYSAGFTGEELAGYMLESGARDAAMLDGGASTEMLVEGRLVSRPSFKGQERPVCGGILVILK